MYAFQTSYAEQPEQGLEVSLHMETFPTIF